MSGKPPKSPGISPMRIQDISVGETKSVSRFKKLKRRISASFKNLSITRETSTADGYNYNPQINRSYVANHNSSSRNLSSSVCHSLTNTPKSKSTQYLITSYVSRSTDDNLNQNSSPTVYDNSNNGKINGQNSMSRHHSSAGDFLAINPMMSRGTTPLKLRPSRPKSEGNLSLHSLKSKRASSFGSNSPFGKVELYQKHEQLGKGSYATVYKGFSLLTNSVVALKEIKLETEEGTPFTAIREASLLKGLKHANIVTLHDIVHTKTSLTFVFEYLQTDLGQYLEKHKGGLNPQNIKLFMFQLLRGISFCHDRHILHRDLKPQNLLIGEKGDLKLADFGLARAKSIPSKTYSDEVVTLWYRPPDLLLGSTDYSTSLDMWGVGCIFVEMINGTAVFPGLNDVYDQLNRIWMILGTPTESSWPGVSQLPNYSLSKMARHHPKRWSHCFPKLMKISYAEPLVICLLQLIPSRRISAVESLKHPYFADLPGKIFDLNDDVSIFNLPNIQLASEYDHFVAPQSNHQLLHLHNNPHLLLKDVSSHQRFNLATTQQQQLQQQQGRPAHPQIRTNPHHVSKNVVTIHNINRLAVNEYSGPSAV